MLPPNELGDALFNVHSVHKVLDAPSEQRALVDVLECPSVDALLRKLRPQRLLVLSHFEWLQRDDPVDDLIGPPLSVFGGIDHFARSLQLRPRRLQLDRHLFELLAQRQVHDLKLLTFRRLLVQRRHQSVHSLLQRTDLRLPVRHHFLQNTTL